MGELNKKLKNRRQNSDTFNTLEQLVSQTTVVTIGMDKEKDSSHGLFFSSALSEDTDQVKLHATLWGHQKDIASMLYTICRKNPEFAGIISKVAINIAFDRMHNQQGKQTTENIPENN